MPELRICHLYSDLLNLYGDRGNIISMVQRLKRREIGVSVTEVGIGAPLNAENFDIFMLGGGQDFAREVLMKDLRSLKAEPIREAVENDKVFLAICFGYQIMGNYLVDSNGEQSECVGALDIYTEFGEIGRDNRAKRLIGNCLYSSPEFGEIAAFENHSGLTYLGENVRPLAAIIKGYGNNGKDGTEGARYRNVFATYGHGPVLPKNPDFCDYILKTAMNKKYPEYYIEQLDNQLEKAAFDYIKAAMMK